MRSQTDTSVNPRPDLEPIALCNTVERFVEDTAQVLTKPRMRGWIHFYSAWLAIITGATLVSLSWALASPRAGHSTLVYAAATVAMFAVSATYHRVNWTSPVARMRMKRLDHSMIFVFIAGSYTPFARLAMPQDTGVQVRWMVWGGAAA
ncbi:MAG: hemolysin III family protein, partial [Mycobacterium sp.]|nr:hemolysin III family protein [Mycobacterium sp.]